MVVRCAQWATERTGEAVLAHPRARSRAAALGVLLLVSLALSACTTSSATVGPSTAGPSGSPAASRSASRPAAALKAFDWTTVTLPASSCDPAATGDITLVAGKGTVQVDARTAYVVTVDLPPDFGEVAGRPAAVLRYSCLLQGANGVGMFPIAVFFAGSTGPERAGILQSPDLGSTANGSTLSHDSVSFVAGQILVTGNYLAEGDARCCASGVGWTSIAFVYGRLAPSRVVATGARPATLPRAEPGSMATSSSTTRPCGCRSSRISGISTGLRRTSRTSCGA